jgi:hypothetical protein
MMYLGLWLQFRLEEELLALNAEHRQRRTGVADKV